MILHNSKAQMFGNLNRFMIMRFLIATLLLLSSFPVAKAADIMVLENPVPANSFAECSVTVPEGGSVIFLINPMPTKTVEFENRVLFNGPAGTYSVNAVVISIKDGKAITKKYTQTVVIGKSPQPPPVDPIPTDAFSKAIQEAYTAETDPNKLTYIAKLGALYRQSAKSTVQDASITTNGQLFDVMLTASRTMLPEAAIPKVRAEVGKRLNPLFGAASSPIDRAKFAAEFNAVADALSAAK